GVLIGCDPARAEPGDSVVLPSRHEKDVVVLVSLNVLPEIPTFRFAAETFRLGYRFRIIEKGGTAGVSKKLHAEAVFLAQVSEAVYPHDGVAVPDDENSFHGVF